MTETELCSPACRPPAVDLGAGDPRRNRHHPEDAQTADEHKKRCFAPRAARELQMRTARHRRTPVSTATARTPTAPRAARTWSQGLAAAVGASVAASCEPERIRTTRSRRRAPWRLPKGGGNLRPHATCTWTCVAALLIVAQTGKQPGRPSAGGG